MELPSVFKPSLAQDSNVVPAASYLCSIVKAVMKDTNAKDGKYLSLQFKIADGKNKGRVLFQNFNLVNKNPTAVRIAESELKGLCEAIGIDELKDTEQLQGQTVVCKVGIKAETAADPARNVIKGYKPESDYVAEGEESPFE
jgi:hypothetical protein